MLTFFEINRFNLLTYSYFLQKVLQISKYFIGQALINFKFIVETKNKINYQLLMKISRPIILLFTI